MIILTFVAPRIPVVVVTLTLLFGVDGIEGIIYVGPVADAMAITLAVVMLFRELRELKRLNAGEISADGK